MLNKFLRGLNWAMIPCGIVGIISIGFLLLLGIGFLVVVHGLLFSSMLEGNTNIYCLMIVLVFDPTILLFLWGCFGKKALWVFPIILLVIGILNIKILIGALGALAFLYIIIAGIAGAVNNGNKRNIFDNTNMVDAPRHKRR